MMTPLKNFPFDLRPREKMAKRGAQYLSEVELLAVIIGTGKKGENALQLAEKILVQIGGLEKLAQASLREISSLEGVGLAKGARIQASFELAKRAFSLPREERVKISRPQDVALLVSSHMSLLDKEHFKAIILSVKNEVLKVVDITVGSLSSAVVEPRELFREVLKENGAGVVIVHNHPSGDPAPSEEDISFTLRLKKGAEILGIELIDHLIIGKGSFVSLKELEVF
jgi:DNA repair protein RadC